MSSTLAKLIKSFFVHKSPTTSYYRLVSVDQSNPKKISLLCQVIGTGDTFSNYPDVLYESKLISKFSPQDAAYIGLLYATQTKENSNILQYLPANENKNSTTLLLISTLFSALLILSNLITTKIVHVFSTHFNAGLLFFPLTLIIMDIVTEVYGFYVSRKIILIGFLANLLVIIGCYIVLILPASGEWLDQDAYNTVFYSSFRVFIGSSVGYFFGEFINSFILAKFKIMTAGKYFWLRALGSTVIGELFDGLAFYSISFLGRMPLQEILHISSFSYIVGLIYEIFLLPITYYICQYLKKKDKIDHYDYNLSFLSFEK